MFKSKGEHLKNDGSPLFFSIVHIELPLLAFFLATAFEKNNGIILTSSNFWMFFQRTFVGFEF